MFCITKKDLNDQLAIVEKDIYQRTATLIIGKKASDSSNLDKASSLTLGISAVISSGLCFVSRAIQVFSSI
jgi:hypothetical protein